VNHRPVFGISKATIEAAFTAIGCDPMNRLIERDTFFELLATRGECLTGVELEACLRALLGDAVTQIDMLEEHITPKIFAQNLLGFEDYDENDAPASQPPPGVANQAS